MDEKGQVEPNEKQNFLKSVTDYSNTLSSKVLKCHLNILFGDALGLNYFALSHHKKSAKVACQFCLTPWKYGSFTVKVLPGPKIGKKMKKVLQKRNQNQSLSLLERKLIDSVHIGNRLVLRCNVCQNNSMFKVNKEAYIKVIHPVITQVPHVTTKTKKKKKKKKNKNTICGLKAKVVKNVQNSGQKPNKVPKEESTSADCESPSESVNRSHPVITQVPGVTTKTKKKKKKKKNKNTICGLKAEVVKNVQNSGQKPNKVPREEGTSADCESPSESVNRSQRNSLKRKMENDMVSEIMDCDVRQLKSVKRKRQQILANPLPITPLGANVTLSQPIKKPQGDDFIPLEVEEDNHSKNNHKRNLNYKPIPKKDVAQEKKLINPFSNECQKQMRKTEKKLNRWKKLIAGQDSNQVTSSLKDFLSAL